MIIPALLFDLLGVDLDKEEWRGTGVYHVDVAYLRLYDIAVYRDRYLGDGKTTTTYEVENPRFLRIIAEQWNIDRAKVECMPTDKTWTDLVDSIKTTSNNE